MKKALAVAFSLAVVASLVYVLYQGFGADPHKVPFLLVGKPAPEFTMKRLDGQGVLGLKDFAGKPLVINFWATFCVPCKYEQPTLDFASDKYRDRVQFVGIVFEGDEDKSKEFLKQNGATYINLFDPKSTTAVDFGVTGVPETYFINRQGIIVKKIEAPILDPAEFDELVKDIL
jgi:cytochrome c biogenesis protein CcmG, thiol:disulfide interchange protein DsbE